MKQNRRQSSDIRHPVLSVQNDLFTTITPAASSQISGGHWNRYSASFPAPPQIDRHSYGRVPSYSHQIAAQRLNQALFA